MDPLSRVAHSWLDPETPRPPLLTPTGSARGSAQGGLNAPMTPTSRSPMSRPAALHPSNQSPAPPSPNLRFVKNLETYVKDLHWVAEKTMLISEKNFAMLDDLHQYHSHTKVLSESLTPHFEKELPAVVVSLDSEHTDQVIRECILEGLREVHLPLPDVSDLKQLGEKMESVHGLVREHSTTLDLVLKKINNLSIPSLSFESGRAEDLGGGFRIQARADQTVGFSPQLLASYGDSLGRSLALPETCAVEQLEFQVPPEIHSQQDAPSDICETSPVLKEPSQHSMICTSCGNKLMQDAAFCRKCGMQRTLSTKCRQKRVVPCLERFVSSQPFEMVFGLLIVLNTVNMCVEAEYRGWSVGYYLGIEGMQTTTKGADEVFEVIALAFGIIFTLEVLLKLVAFKCRFFKSSWNIFDCTIIIISWVDYFSNVDMLINPMLLRLLRIVRMMRLLRGLGSLQQYFENLHLMVRGIQAAAPVLLWVIILVYPLLACCALFMNFTLQAFMEDLSKPEADRLECYRYFGTFTKALLSMFECTFGNWVPICRFLYSKIDERFAIFMMSWKLVVGIAILRIIYGVFLHVTFACANSDDEDVINQKNRESALYEKKMRSFFTKYDEGLGYLTRERFLELMLDPRARTWLSGYLDLEIGDPELMLDLVDDGNGDDIIPIEQLVHGFAGVKGPARNIDVCKLLHITREAISKFDKVLMENGCRSDAGSELRSQLRREPSN